MKIVCNYISDLAKLNLTENLKIVPLCNGLLIIICNLFCSGCKEYLETGPPKTQLVTSVVFSNDNTANAAMNGVYAYMWGNSTGGSFRFFLTSALGASADELYYVPTLSTYDEFKNNGVTGLNSVNFALWSELYNIIYQTNSIIENISLSVGVSVSMKNQLLGEAKFVRSLCYFYLVNMFGDVPLISSTDVNLSALAPRTTLELVYDHIVSDLTDAQSLLIEDYSFSGGERTRANKWAATALLARVYLYMRNWSNAEAQASAVIASDNCTLVPLDSVFLKNSKEALLQLNTSNTSYNGYTQEGSSFVLAAGVTPVYMMYDIFPDVFEQNDIRRRKWVYSSYYSVGSTKFTYYDPWKYKQTAATTDNTAEYYMLFRLGEQYLIRAEARAQQNKIPESQADLNAIRARAGLGNTTANDKPSLLSAIEHERQVELFAELGHRWFDLKRTGRIDAVMSAFKPTFWQHDDALFPIPENAILTNPNLTQNPGY